MAPAKPGQQRFDMLMLGLLWLRQNHNEKVITRPGTSIMGAMTQAGLYTEKERRQFKDDSGLISRTMESGKIYHLRHLPPRSQLFTIASECEQLLAIFARARPFQFANLFGGGPDKYPLLITDRGIAYAQALAPKYAGRITAAKFDQGWERYRQQLQAAASKAAQSSAPTPAPAQLRIASSEHSADEAPSRPAHQPDSKNRDS